MGPRVGLRCPGFRGLALDLHVVADWTTPAALDIFPSTSLGTRPSRARRRLRSSLHSISLLSPSKASESILSHWPTLGACSSRSLRVSRSELRLDTETRALISQSLRMPVQPILRSYRYSHSLTRFGGS